MRDWWRRTNGRRLFGALMLMLLLAALGSGRLLRAQPAPERLGVAAAVRLAETNSPELNRLRAAVEAARAARLTTLGLDAPTVSYAREGIGAGGFNEQRVVVSQAFDFPTTGIYRFRQAGREADALERRLEALLRQTKARVKQAYTRVLYAREIEHLRTEELALARALIDAVTTRLEVGEASPIDRMKADLQRAQAQDNLDAAHRDFLNARYDLFRAIGLDPEAQRYEIVFPDTLAYVPVVIDQEAALARLDGQPEVREALTRVEAADYGVRAARSSLLPRVHLSYWPQDFGTGYDFHAFEVGLSVPLWGWLDGRGRIRQARAERRRRQWETEAVRLDLKRAIEQAWHRYDASRQVIERFNQTVQERAATLLALTREGYRLGEIDLLTLLDTQRTYLDSQLRFYQALRDYYLDVIALEQFLGRDLVFPVD